MIGLQFKLLLFKDMTRTKVITGVHIILDRTVTLLAARTLPTKRKKGRMDIMGQWAISAIHTKLGSKFRVYHYVISVQHKAFNETVESFTALEQRIQLQMFPNTGLELFLKRKKSRTAVDQNSDCPIYTHGYTAGD